LKHEHTSLQVRTLYLYQEYICQVCYWNKRLDSILAVIERAKHVLIIWWVHYSLLTKGIGGGL